MWENNKDHFKNNKLGQNQSCFLKTRPWNSLKKVTYEQKQLKLLEYDSFVRDGTTKNYKIWEKHH